MASATEADICNRGLARIGHKVFIADLANDVSEEADIARLFYPDERDSLLMQAPWPFATRRATLAEVNYAVEPLRDGWGHIYYAPADLLEPLYIWPGGLTVPSVQTGPSSLTVALALQTVWQNPRTPRADQRVPFSIEAASAGDGKIILCDYATAKLVYTARLTDVAQFS